MKRKIRDSCTQKLSTRTYRVAKRREKTEEEESETARMKVQYGTINI
jgi:hypothetical protein